MAKWISSIERSKEGTFLVRIMIRIARPLTSGKQKTLSNVAYFIYTPTLTLRGDQYPLTPSSSKIAINVLIPNKRIRR